MNIPTALIFTGMICLGIGATTMAYFAVKGFKTMAQVGKAYVKTLVAFLTVIVIGLAAATCWYEITTPPAERLSHTR
ncbi:hypothetical protein KUL72_20935 [Bradyrhizobium arachidis]|uniref:hypothetical protein n=1 Tax=Bradyrhizobium arachidis TaxID=858423 RepID=UPI002161DC8E|nr:hypothetical protein [Bradyrhizobium arachidis]UVO33980.1 hypothetical protein KUL72_20935 [Bradyrhizobium arachidis]